jgi:hypothetical protein
MENQDNPQLSGHQSNFTPSINLIQSNSDNNKLLLIIGGSLLIIYST